MGAETEISWTHHTFNPWWGCVQVSPACGLPMPGQEGKPHGTCYAKVLDARFPILGQTHWGKDAPRRFFGDKHWEEPLKWNRDAKKAGVRRRVFCASMADVMEEYPGLQPSRVRLYNLIEDTPCLDWLLLTKRPQNFRRFLPARWIDRPRPNVWGMTTVESPQYLNRIDTLKACPFVIHGLSIEPLLADMPTLDQHLDGIDWVIVGGESGAGARPMYTDWARSVRDKCIRLGIPFHFKQWGEWAPVSGAAYHIAPPMKRVGKGAAGRHLDARTWDDFPALPACAPPEDAL